MAEEEGKKEKEGCKKKKIYTAAPERGGSLPTLRHHKKENKPGFT